MLNLPIVLILDDEPASLRSLQWLVEKEGICAKAYTSASQFLQEFVRRRPCCIVLDLRMPGVDGIDVMQQLAARGDLPPTIIVTGLGDVASCAEAFKKGAFDFLEKPVDPRALVDRIRQALAADAERSAVSVSPSEAVARGMDLLTAREREALDHLLAGRTLKQISALFGVTVQTVWKRRASILRKFGVENQVDLVRLLLTGDRAASAPATAAPPDAPAPPAPLPRAEEGSGESDL